MRRKGYDRGDLNYWRGWLEWRMAFLLVISVLFALFFTLVNLVVTMTRLSGGHDAGWAWLTGLCAIGCVAVVSFVLGAWPEPVVRLVLRVAKGPQREMSPGVDDAG